MSEVVQQTSAVTPEEIRAIRESRRYRNLRAEFREHCADLQLPCWLDGKPIDYDLPSDHPDAWSLDHAHPVSERPDLALDPANFRPAHLDCNKRRGNRAPFILLGTPSEDW